MHASSPLLVTPVTPVSVQDPLLTIISTIKRHQSEKEVIKQLYTDYSASPDIRASLRLVPLGYIDALSVASEASTVVVSPTSKQNDYAASGQTLASGSQLLQLLQNHALEGQDYAAVMLSDILDNADVGGSIPPQKIPAMYEAVKNILLSRVSDKQAELDIFATLLQATGRLLTNAQWDSASLSDWVEELLLALVDAVTDIPVSTVYSNHNGAQVLCLMAQLLSHRSNQAIEVMSKLKSLRRLARHLIKLLSQPSPLLAAPALHVLTRILLHPQHTKTAHREEKTALTILADTLGGKLFDEVHIERTLILIADMCLNCHAADELADNPTFTVSDNVIIDDLRVLDAAAGVIHAIATAQTSDVSARLFQSTAITSAIDHLVSMAKLDRRYLGPLLRMVNPILLYSNGDTTLPLISSLLVDRSNNHTSKADESIAEMPSIVDEIFDAVLLGIEDAIDTVPRFVPPAENSTIANELLRTTSTGDLPSSGRNPSWPRVSCEERDCGWFVNSSQYQRQSVHDFLRVLLPLQSTIKANRFAGWISEFLETATQVLCTFLLPQPSTTKEAKVDDPFCTFSVDARGIKPGAANNQVNYLQLQQDGSENLVTVLGTYYWVVRPVMLMVSDLVKTSKYIATCWHRCMGEKKVLCIDHWIQTFFQKVVDEPEALLGQALYTEIGQILALSDDPATDFTEALLPKSVQRTVATPSDSVSSSITASPRQEREVIGIDDLRAANHKSNMDILSDTVLPIRKNMSGNMAQTAVLRHWARTCEVELVALLVSCRAHAVNNQERIEQVKTIHTLVQRSRSLLALPTYLEEAGTAHFLDSLSLGVLVRAQNMKQRQSHQTLLIRRLHEQQSTMASIKDQNIKLQNALQQAEGNNSRLYVLCNQHQEENNQLKREKEELSSIIVENQHSQHRLETDAQKWKDEYLRAQNSLEQSESMGREGRQQFLKLTEKQQLLQESFSKKQESWEQKQLSMTENIRKLEIALSEAVARLRELESLNSTERNTANQLRNQVSLMNSKLAEYSKISESLYNISRLPH